MRDSLKAKVGSKVTLQLLGGQEVSGKIVEVGDQAVHLSELTGKEFYDALVRLDHISTGSFDNDIAIRDSGRKMEE